ncbi:MAG: hypothetical protein NTY38_02210 [Acidobacteria bacterium]|nr:hypothetical protein [Acidobacteriota bacterium]
MAYRLRPWQFSALVIFLCAVIIGSVYFFQGRERTVAEQMRHLPAAEGVTLYLDLRALRSSGILARIAGAPGVQEPEYRAFVKQTGFDYRQDLDSVLARFTPGATYLILTGHFHWNELAAYVLNSQGQCRNGFCKMAGSEPDRQISFLAYTNRILGMAVSASPEAAFALAARRPASTELLPASPFWMTFSPSFLRSSEKFPGGTRLFAKALADADRVTLTVGQEGQQLAAGLEARCHSSLAAQSLLNQMTGLTELVRRFIARSGQTPNASDLSGVLTSGTFTRQENVVRGRWPLDWAFIDALGSSR